MPVLPQEPGSGSGNSGPEAQSGGTASQASPSAPENAPLVLVIEKDQDMNNSLVRLLARHYRSLAEWRREMEEAAGASDDPDNPARRRLLDVHGIGADMAADIVGFFAEPHNRAILDDLAREIAVLDYDAPSARIASLLAGKTIVATIAFVPPG